MNEILNYINGLHRRRGRPSSGIIYCRTRMTCDDLSNYLQGKGLNCRPYHKGIKCVEVDTLFRNRVSENLGLRSLIKRSRGGRKVVMEQGV